MNVSLPTRKTREASGRQDFDLLLGEVAQHAPLSARRVTGGAGIVV